jgi:hypothetical protein
MGEWMKRETTCLRIMVLLCRHVSTASLRPPHPTLSHPCVEVVWSKTVPAKSTAQSQHTLQMSRKLSILKKSRRTFTSACAAPVCMRSRIGDVLDGAWPWIFRLHGVAVAVFRCTEAFFAHSSAETTTWILSTLQWFFAQEFGRAIRRFPTPTKIEYECLVLTMRPYRIEDG